MTHYITLREAARQLDADDTWRRFQVDYAPASKDQFSIEVYRIAQNDEGRMRYIRDEGMDRDPGWGTFRRLVETIPGDMPERLVWMSDTRAEIMEHTPIFNKLFWAQFQAGKRLLVNGLGLGVVVHGALTYNDEAHPESVGHIDVVEANPVVAELASQYLPEDLVTVHVADAYTIKWPRGTRWDLAWHDIWPTISEDNLPGMDALLKKYQNRVIWQGCWQRHGCLKMRRIMRQLEAGTLPAEQALDMMLGKFRP